MVYGNWHNNDANKQKKSTQNHNNMNKKAKIIITVLAILCIWFWMSAKFCFNNAYFCNLKTQCT